jgi:Phage tail tube protein
MINTGSTPSRDDSFTFVMSQKLNNSGTLTEMFQIATGASISDVTISVKSGEVVTVDSNWIANNISTWATTSGFTTPTFASALNATPWSSVTTGANPFTFNTLTYDVRNFSCKVDQNPDRVQVVGQTGTNWIQPTTREITVDVEIVYKDTALIADTKTMTARAASFNLNSTGPKQLSFTDMYLEAYDEKVSADDTSIKTISYTGFAASVSIN